MNNDYNYKNIMDEISQGKKPMVMYHISKEEVVNLDTKPIDNLFNTLKRIGKGVRQCVVITCGGYDHLSEELFEIIEVRKFVKKVFEKHPYIFYYLNTEFETETWFLSCLFDFETLHFGEKLNSYEIFKKYGLDLNSTPKLEVHLIDNDNLLPKLLKAIVIHAKNNKDSIGGKKVAIEYAKKFDNALKNLKKIGINEEEARELGYE